MTIVLLTVTCAPEKGGTVARRIVDAMQPPVAVPANGGPFTIALVTRPDGANVTTTIAVPLGSPSLRHDAAACEAAVASAVVAAVLSNGGPSAAGAAAAVAAAAADSAGLA